METSNLKVIFESKKKSYDSIENEELKQHFDILRNKPLDVTFLSLNGNSYSLNFCKEFAKLLPPLINLEVHQNFHFQ